MRIPEVAFESKGGHTFIPLSSMGQFEPFNEGVEVSFDPKRVTLTDGPRQDFGITSDGTVLCLLGDPHPMELFTSQGGRLAWRCPDHFRRLYLEKEHLPQAEKGQQRSSHQRN